MCHHCWALLALSPGVFIQRFKGIHPHTVIGPQSRLSIRLDPSVDPVQHAPRRVQVAVRSKLQSTLEDMVQQDVLPPVTEPTPWISSMVVVSKRNGKLRICLDPKDLNVAVQIEHHPLPRIHRNTSARCPSLHYSRCKKWILAHLPGLCSTPLTRNSEVFAGRECLLGSAVPQRYFSERRIN